MKPNTNLALILLALLMSCTKNQPVTVSSPDGSLELEFQSLSSSDSLRPSSGISFSVKRNGELILDNSSFMLYFKNTPPFGQGLDIVKKSKRRIDEQWERIWGKRKIVINRCNELEIKLREQNPPGRNLSMIFRIYDDGIAFRYYIPEQEEITDFKIANEKTTFRFTGDHKIWATRLGNFRSAQEQEFDETRISKLLDEDIIGTPLLIKINDSDWAAILEANLTDWAGMCLSGQTDIPHTVRTILSPRLDEPDVVVKSSTPRYSPWRVIMLADYPGRFIESDLLHNLNEPCAIENPGWIKPGKSAWDWWWSFGYAPDMNRKLGADTESHKYFIDFASEMGWDYQLVDWYWYGLPFASEDSREFNPESDITSHTDTCNIPELIEYADSRGVKLILWLNWVHVDMQMDKAFPLYEKWGIAGVKVDFMNRNNQEIVNFYHRLVKKAAQHHLIVDCHGAYMPTGISRTWPNFLTREGVLGNEYTKWSERITLDHCLTLPYTRMLGGEMDFTPGGFVHATRGTFKVATEAGLPYAMVKGTRCLQLAMLVVYESALQVLCDSPYNYRNQPQGLDFLKIVPTTWDETIVINGEVGDFITIARKSSEDWYIGCMTDWTARELEISLDFLGDGSYKAKIWSDAPDADVHPEKLVETETILTRDQVHIARLAPGGGQVIHLSPVK
ncbi:glycoside hydrolase family 97 protein [Bacteroidota bacterium]